MENLNKKTTEQNQELNTQKNASATKNNYGLPIEFHNSEIEHYFLELIKNEDWRENFTFANNDFMGCNGADKLYEYLYYFKITNGVKDLFNRNECEWLINFIISTTKYSLLPTDFLVWRLLIDKGRNFIICDDGDYNVLVSYELDFTDFTDYGSSAVTLYLINDVLLLPEEY